MRIQSCRCSKGGEAALLGGTVLKRTGGASVMFFTVRGTPCEGRTEGIEIEKPDDEVCVIREKADPLARSDSPLYGAAKNAKAE